MGVAETVYLLTEAIERAKSPWHPRHRICLELLRLLPEYRDINKLPAWESAFQGALDSRDDESEIGQIPFEVFEFGRCNMYGEFDLDRTVYEFERLSSWLADRGIVVPAPEDLSQW